MKRNANLYQECPACGGSGTLIGPITVTHADGTTTQHLNHPCPSCKPLRVVPVGVTTGQLERLVKAELATKGGG